MSISDKVYNNYIMKKENNRLFHEQPFFNYELKYLFNEKPFSDDKTYINGFISKRIFQNNLQLINTNSLFLK